MTAPPITPENLANLLSALTQPDTNTIRQAEQQLKPLLKNPATMHVMWQLVSDNNQSQAVRQVGAIVLRKRLPTHYGNETSNDARLQWQQQILQTVAVEPLRPVRMALVGLVAAIIAVEPTLCDPLWQFLNAASTNAQPEARELCFLQIMELSDIIGTHWRSHLPALQQLFTNTLQNAQEDATVQKTAVQALGQLMTFWVDDPEMDAMAPLLPILLQIASRSWSDQDFLSTVLEALYELTYSTSTALQPYWGMVVEFAIECLQTKTLELRVRDSAALVLATTAEFKSKTLTRNEPLLGKLLDVVFQLVQDSPESAAGALFESNPAWKQDLLDSHTTNDDLDDDDAEEDSPTETSIAQGTLDQLACQLPKRYIWQAAYSRCIDRMNSPDPNARKAGVASLGVIAEGCADPLTASLSQAMPMILRAAQDSAPQVRECACFCLGQVSEHCQPDVLQYSQQILPIVFQLLDDHSVAVQATSCYVLEMFCERLEPHAVRPLLDALVRKLVGMLEVTQKRSVQEMAVAALAATAVAAEEEFSPYVEGVCNLIGKLLLLQDSNLFTLRGRALECMGHIAIAVGKDTFRPYFPITMKSAMEGLTKDSTELQEFAYAVFANLAKVMKDEFAPALADLVPHLCAIIDMDEGQLESTNEGGAAGLSGLDDSDDEEDEGNLVLHVRTAMYDVKKGAITALSEMASHTGGAFCPYIEQSMQVLQKAFNNWYPQVKCEAADAMPSLIIPAIAAYHNGAIEWKKGDVTASNTLNQHTLMIVQAVLSEELALLQDEDKMVVTKACESIQTVIELCGPQALVPISNEVLTAVVEILSKSSICQTVDAIYGEVVEEDDDQDNVAQAACDLLGGVCRVMGTQFAQFLNQFLPLLCEYVKTSRPATDRSMAIGCLSEIAQELEGSIYEYWTPVFLPALLSGLSDTDESVLRNAAFGAGVCCEQLGEKIASDVPNLLTQLGPIFSLDASRSDATAACVDNAAAAVSRMIMAVPNVVPLSQVLPALLQALPLKTDMTENETVYKCLLGLVQSGNADVMVHKDRVKEIMTKACSQESKVDDSIKQNLYDALQSLSS